MVAGAVVVGITGTNCSLCARFRVLFGTLGVAPGTTGVVVRGGVAVGAGTDVGASSGGIAPAVAGVGVPTTSTEPSG